jgi:hypothetical protein
LLAVVQADHQKVVPSTSLAEAVELAQSAATALELPLQAQLVVLEELEHLLQLLFQ